MIEMMYDQYIQNLILDRIGVAFSGFDFAKEVYSEEDRFRNFQEEFRVINLINAYVQGHLFTKTNPV